MDFVSPVPFAHTLSEPVFIHQSEKIRAAVGKLQLDELKAVMRVSDRLAREIQSLYRTPARDKAAFWAYTGDVYRGLQAPSMSMMDGDWAQEHFLVPSAVYGLLRPYDAIRPYRLEMQAKLAVDGNATMYEFWGETLARYVQAREQQPLLVLSSDEYARAVTRSLPASCQVITPQFFDTKPDGTVGQVPIYSKQMRGVMARWVIDNRVEDPARLPAFSGQGYMYDAVRSAEGAPVYTRKHMKPLDLPTKAGLQNIR